VQAHSVAADDHMRIVMQNNILASYPGPAVRWRFAYDSWYHREFRHLQRCWVTCQDVHVR
jgi:hypothetical protein